MQYQLNILLDEILSPLAGRYVVKHKWICNRKRCTLKRKTILLAVLSLLALLAASCGAGPTTPDSTASTPIASDPAASEPIISDSRDSEPSACIEMIFTYFFNSRQGIGTDILAICPDGSDPRQVTTSGPNTNAPRWSPDRTQIAYLSDRSGSNQLHIMDKDGGNDRQLTSASDLEAWNVLWLPDGNRIALWGVFNDDWQWQAFNVLTGEITPLSEWAFEGGDVSLSHDGTRLAYTAHTKPEDHYSPIEIFVQDMDVSNQYQLTSTGWIIENLVWSPDDSQIAFLSSSAISPDQNSPDSIQNAIYTIDLDGSNLHELLLPDLNPRSFAWSPDGKSLAVTTEEMFDTGDIECPEGTLQTLYLLNIITSEKTALYKAIAPNRITHLSWY